MRTIHAMRISHAGRALDPEDVVPPMLAEHQLRLQVLACGVCRTDLHLVDV
jgi:D-arabinose 1-dehydrogenase-like Zn-dependent alcohol dehydrogenase